LSTVAQSDSTAEPEKYAGLAPQAQPILPDLLPGEIREQLIA
jgi:hypothetical protein